jgi:cytochrome c oxidase subunit 3
MNTAVLLTPRPATGSAIASRALDTGLWAFIAVASTRFALCLTAYVMRMDGADWSTIALPRQLWLSSALLLVGSVLLQRAGTAARAARWPAAQILLLAGGACAMAFIGAQLWAWQSLLAARVMPAGNPAASFFYVLTALHGLHVLGGLIAWAATLASLPSASQPSSDPERAASRVALCARYWHFLLAVWAVLFVTLGWLTPDVVRFICGKG